MRFQITILAIILCIFIPFGYKMVTDHVVGTYTKGGVNEEEELIWSKNATKTIDEVKETLAERGWSNIRGAEGLVDTIEVRPVFIDPTPEEKSMIIYTVMGEVDGMYDNDIMAMVRISFNDKMSEGNVYKVLYISESGRDMIKEEIIDAHDEELWDCMYSY